MHKAVKEAKKRFPEGPPLLDPINDMKIQEQEFADTVKKIEILEKRFVLILLTFALMNVPIILSLFLLLSLPIQIVFAFNA